MKDKIFEENKPHQKLTFQFLREQNANRCIESFKSCDNWFISDWAMALTGELGELCNFLKKSNRGEYVDAKNIEYELADIQIYLDLLAYKLDVDLEKAVREKFNIVSDRVNSKRYL